MHTGFEAIHVKGHLKQTRVLSGLGNCENLEAKLKQIVITLEAYMEPT